MASGIHHGDQSWRWGPGRWPTTYQLSYLQQYKTGSQVSQRIQSIPGEISVPNSLTTSRGLLRNLELNGILVGSTRRKVNPSGNSLGGSSRRTPSLVSTMQSS